MTQYEARRNNNVFTSTNPIDVLYKADYPRAIWINGDRFIWTTYASAALIEAARIEIFHNSHLAPIDIEEDVLNLLNRKTFSRTRIADIYRNNDSDFYRYVEMLDSAYYHNNPRPIMRIFHERRRGNSALDLHFLALLYYHKYLRCELSPADALSHYERLEGNPIRDYFKRIILCTSMRDFMREYHGWRMEEELG